MPSADELLAAACTSGISCLNEKNLLVAIAQGASTGGGGGGGGGGTLSTDGTFAANSDLLYPSQKAAKTYVDAAQAAAIASSNATADSLYVKKAGDTMTGALLLPNGAVGAPSLSHAADANTGLWFPAADTIAFSTAGAERLRFLSTGEITATITSDAAFGVFSVGTGNPTLNVDTVNRRVGIGFGFLPAYALSINYTDATTYLASSIAPQGILVFNTDTAAGSVAPIYLGTGAANSAYVSIAGVRESSNNSALTFRTEGGDIIAEQMRITSTGAVGIGLIAPLARLHITPSASGTDYFRIDHSDGTPRLQVGVLTGSVTLGALWFGNIVPSATNYGLASDGTTLRVGSPIAIPSGANQRAGNAVLVGGTVTVLNTTVTANTIVLLTRKVTGGTIGFAVTYTVIAATSFAITSDNVLDTSTYSYLLIEVP